MSGHSKWKQIKYQKGANDSKRAHTFTKLGKAITLAAQMHGGDPAMNSSLRMAIDAAKSENMPSDNIERAIKKGTGELQSERVSQLLYEAFAPGGVAILVEALTDNINRSVADLRRVLTLHNGKLAAEGSVRWQFREEGHFNFIPNDLKTLAAEVKKTLYSRCLWGKLFYQGMDIFMQQLQARGQNQLFARQNHAPGDRFGLVITDLYYSPPRGGQSDINS